MAIIIESKTSDYLGAAGAACVYGERDIGIQSAVAIIIGSKTSDYLGTAETACVVR